MIYSIESRSQILAKSDVGFCVLLKIWVEILAKI